MIVHEQFSTDQKSFYEIPISELSSGSLDIPSGSCRISGTVFSLPAYAPVIGDGAFRLWVERIGTGADYFLDRFAVSIIGLHGLPSDSILVAWRDAIGDPIHVLRHVRE